MKLFSNIGAKLASIGARFSEPGSIRSLAVVLFGVKAFIPASWHVDLVSVDQVQDVLTAGITVLGLVSFIQPESKAITLATPAQLADATVSTIHPDLLKAMATLSAFGAANGLIPAKLAPEVAALASLVPALVPSPAPAPVVQTVQVPVPVAVQLVPVPLPEQVQTAASTLVDPSGAPVASSPLPVGQIPVPVASVG